MKRWLALLALALCAVLPAAAATDVSISCIGTASDDCPVAVDVVLEQETLVAAFFQRRADGTAQRETFFWCPGEGAAGPWRWQPAAGPGCETTGAFRVLAGEFTRRHLALAGMVFSTRQVQSLCGASHGPACTAPTLARGKFRLACIGPEGPDCPVAVDVKLQGDGLLASIDGGAGSARQRVDFEWCTGFSVTGDAPLRWWRSQGNPCLVWGASQPLRGELTLRQLVQANASFETRSTQAVCFGEGVTVANPAGTRATCTRVQR